MTTKIDKQDDKVKTTPSKEDLDKNTASVVKEKETENEARISGVSYVSEQDYSADKEDFFKALHGK